MPKLKPFEVPKPDSITKKLPNIENINSSLNRINNATPVDRFRGFRTKLDSNSVSTLKNQGAKVESQSNVPASNLSSFQPERKSQQDSPEQSPITQTSISSEVPNNENKHELTTAKTIARAEGKDSPGNPATDIDTKEPIKVQDQGNDVIDSEQLRKQRLEEIITELKTQGSPKYVGDLAPSEEYYFTHEVPAQAKAILLQRYPEYAAQNTPDKPVTTTAKEPKKDKVPVTTKKENDAPTEKATTPTNEQTPKPATKEPQKDTVPRTAENQQTNPLPEQPAKTAENQQPKPKELSDSELSEAESVRPQDRQERIENVVKSLESQVKALEEALKQGSDFQENLRKGIFGPKVLFMLRLINILANNSVITKLLKLDSKVADIKDLWRSYQEAKNNSRNRKRNPDAIQFAATFNGEAQDKGSEAKEANFENANKEFIKEKSQGFLNEIASELQEEGMGTESIQKEMFDEIDSLVDAGREVDLRRLTQYKPQILDKIKTQVQNFAKGKITKNVLGLNIMIAIRS